MKAPDDDLAAAESLPMNCSNETGDPNRCWKYCTDHPYTSECSVCHGDVRMTVARDEVMGPYHYGCAGWPFCSCPEPHADDDCGQKKA